MPESRGKAFLAELTAGPPGQGAQLVQDPTLLRPGGFWLRRAICLVNALRSAMESPTDPSSRNGRAPGEGSGLRGHSHLRQRHFLGDISGESTRVLDSHTARGAVCCRTVILSRCLLPGGSGGGHRKVAATRFVHRFGLTQAARRHRMARGAMKVVRGRVVLKETGAGVVVV